MKITISFFTIFLFYTHTAISQNTEIVEILDTNLFMTEDSILIKMANIKVPSKYDTVSSRENLVKNILEFNRIHLKKESVRLISARGSCAGDGVQPVHLFKIYPLSEQNINSRFLENGYASYEQCDTLFTQAYSNARQYAVDKKLGIYKKHLGTVYQSKFLLKLGLKLLGGIAGSGFHFLK